MTYFLNADIIDPPTLENLENLTDLLQLPSSAQNDLNSLDFAKLVDTDFEMNNNTQVTASPHHLAYNNNGLIIW